MPSGTPIGDGGQRRDADEQDVLPEQRGELGAVRAPEMQTGSRRGPAAPSLRAAARAAAGRADRSTGRRRRLRRLREHPSASTPTRVASAKASAMSCVTITTVLRTAAWMRRNSRWISARVTGSSAPNGSSISRTADRRQARAPRRRAAAARRRAGPAAARQTWPAVKANQLEQLVDARLRCVRSSQPSRRGTIATFSAMVRCGKSPPPA